MAEIKNVSTLLYDNFGVVNGDGRRNGGLTESRHYWKHGYYRGNPNRTVGAVSVHLDGMTRAKTFEDAAFGAFGDISPSQTADMLGTITSAFMMLFPVHIAGFGLPILPHDFVKCWGITVRLAYLMVLRGRKREVHETTVSSPV